MRLDHGHEATLDDALDFINTLHFESDEHAVGTHDHLGELGAGVEWLAERGLVHRPRHDDVPAARMDRKWKQRAEFIRFEQPTSRIHDDDAEVIGLVFQRRARSALDADYHLARK